MANRDAQLAFVRMAMDANWHDDRIEAWLYCNSVYGTPFPGEYWTLSDALEISDQTIDLYATACRIHQLQKKGGLSEIVTESVGAVASHAAAALTWHALKSLFGHKR